MSQNEKIEEKRWKNKEYGFLGGLKREKDAEKD